mmetsp:Transcript_36024/g.85470  ORF Transcript_36024/g.85470 Transcript_36024/m.85470 type:complete len:84 (+) Transcript_36024:183-434(+)
MVITKMKQWSCPSCCTTTLHGFSKNVHQRSDSWKAAKLHPKRIINHPYPICMIHTAGTMLLNFPEGRLYRFRILQSGKGKIPV